MRRHGPQARFEAVVGLGHQLVPHRRIEQRQPIEAPALARQPRRGVGGDEGRLARQHAVGALGIHQARAVLRRRIPAGEGQKPRRQRHRLGERRAVLVLEVRAPVQRRARQVERDRRLVAAQRHLDDRVGVVGVNGGALAPSLAQGVDDGVFHLERGERGVAQALVGPARPHGQRRAASDKLAPRKRRGARVELVGVARAHAPRHQRDARGEPRPQAGAQGLPLAAEEGHAARKRAHPARAERAQLLGEEVLEPRQAAGEVLAVVGRARVVAHKGSL